MLKPISRKVSIVQQAVILLLVGVLLANAAPSDFQQNKVDQTRRSSSRIDPVTLALNIEIPLGSYPGRGGTSVPLSISYSSKVWSTGTTLGFDSPGGCDNPKNSCPGTHIPELTEAIFANNSVAGWTSSLKVPKIVYTGKSQVFTSTGDPSCSDCYDSYRVQRIHAYLPDGSAHELRKSDVLVSSDLSSQDWSGSYYAVDGSQMRYDTETKTLLMPDGSRYVIYGAIGANDNSIYYDNLSQRIYDNSFLNQPADFIDRNGNKLNYDPTTKQWTDTLGRAFGSPLPPEATSPAAFNHVPNYVAEGDTTYSLPGLGTGTMLYTFKWKKLQYAFSNTNYQLTYPGSQHRQQYPNTNPYSPALFQNTVTMSVFNPAVLTEIVLPDGTSYKFGYNPYGEIDKITQPTGAYEKFTYADIIPIDWQSAITTYDTQVNRGVIEHRVSAKGDGTDEVITQYSAGYATNTYPFALPYKSTTTNPDGTVTERFIYAPDENNPDHFGFENVPSGKVYEERLKRGTTILRRTLTDWARSGPLIGGWSTATRNPRVVRQTEIICEGSQALAKSTTFQHDSYQNVISTAEYDFVPLNYATAQDPATTIGNISLGILKRTTEFYYKTDATADAAYLNRQMTGLAKEKRVKNASGQIVARSQMFYDEATYPTLSYGGTPAHWVDPGTIPRGNATTTRSYYDLANGQYTETHAQYDQFGNLRYGWDGKGNQSEIQYDDSYSDSVNRNSYVLPTRIISPDPTGQNNAAAKLQTSSVYDFNTGLPVSATDANNQTTQMSYSDPTTSIIDPFLRVRKVTMPNGQQTITEYGTGTSPTTNYVKTRTQIDGTNWKEGYMWFDGLKRTVKTQSVDTSGDVFAETEYDNMGRVKRVTNPHRAAETVYWTESFYDDLGRSYKVRTPDNAEVNTTFALGTGATIGQVTTVTDQAGKQRRSITNALGQLFRVDEPTDANGLGTIDSPNQPTVYGYDTLNNLTTVQQSGVNTIQCGTTLASCSQTRSFSYDSLSRLKSATNPEAGTLSYVYDNNGNLTTKTDARNVTTTNVYDALNRVTQRSYANEPTGQLLTPTVNYTYDNLANSKGKLTKVSNGFSTTEYQIFDQMGRVTQSQQMTDGAIYGDPMIYNYNLYGVMVEQKYPSGRVVKNVLDNDSDLAIVQSKKNSASGFFNYAKSFTYTAAGVISSMQLGNGKWESTVFNSRLQPTQIALGTVQSGSDKLKLNFGYGTTGNNGNVISQTITTPSETHGNTTYPAFVATQNYSYDSLNRLKSAEETSPTQPGWKQTYLYDRYGNRNFDLANGNTTTPSPNCVVAVCNPTIDVATNRLVGYTFDNSGNTKVDANSKQFTYDAENKQIEVTQNNISLGKYFYDGTGKRVEKIALENNQWVTTVFIYDASDKLIAEYANPTTTVTPQVSYLTADPLGSPRINTDANGVVISRHDYQPFGEEIARPSYGNDEVRKQFTGYEKDNETDLDFAQARYFKSSLGRFMSPDCFCNDTHAVAPQSWNLYLYTRNNPLKYVDITGNELQIRGPGAGQEYEVVRNGDKAYKLVDINTRKDFDGKDEAIKLLENFINKQDRRTVDALINSEGAQIISYNNASVNSDPAGIIYDGPGLNDVHPSKTNPGLIGEVDYRLNLPAGQLPTEDNVTQAINTINNTLNQPYVAPEIADSPPNPNAPEDKRTEEEVNEDENRRFVQELRGSAGPGTGLSESSTPAPSSPPKSPPSPPSPPSSPPKKPAQH